MPTTPNFALPYPGTSDPPHGPNQMAALATAVDTALATLDAADVALDARLDVVEPRPRGLVARGRRTTTSTATTSIVGVLRLAAFPVLAGRSYQVSATVHPRSTVAGDRVVVEIRHTTDGLTTPVVGSAVLPGGQKYVTEVQSSAAESGHFETTYEPATNHTLWLLLTITRGAGTGNVEAYADATAVTEVAVYDTGVAAGNTGTSV